MLASISLVITPPKVSIPSDNGVTSSSNTSFTSPANTPPWMAAPKATASSGLTLLLGSLPKNSLTLACTIGMRDWPPTKITSSMSLASSLAAFNASRQGAIVRSTNSSVNFSNSARVIFITKCFGPSASAVINGKLISVSNEELSSTLAFSAASLTRCTASGWPAKSTPSCFLNSAKIWSINTWSKSSPPKCVSPLVESTSKLEPSSPAPMSKIVISKVPPPKS